MRSAKTYSFCFSKEERSRTFIGMVYHQIFLFQSSCLLTTILSFKRFASITDSFILYYWVSFWVSYSPFLVSSFALEYHSLSLGCHFGCHSEFSVHLFCLLFRFNVHHLDYLAYHFYCFGVHFRVHFGVHSKFWGSYYRTCYH